MNLLIHLLRNYKTVYDVNQEVKNAFAAYDQLDAIDPYSLDDLQRLHGVMTRLTVEESGVFRSGAEGVYRGGVCIHIATPPEMVPPLMRILPVVFPATPAQTP